MLDKRPFLHICQQCGKPYFPHRPNQQKFCSHACYRKYYRHHGKEHPEHPGVPVLRTFICRNCGKMVRVTDPEDRRQVYCSLACERAYWKHFGQRQYHKTTAEPAERTKISD